MTTQEATNDPALRRGVGMTDIEQKLADLAAGVDQLRVILDATQAWVAAGVAVDLKWQVAELLAEVRAWPRNTLLAEWVPRRGGVGMTNARQDNGRPLSLNGGAIAASGVEPGVSQSICWTQRRSVDQTRLYEQPCS